MSSNTYEFTGRENDGTGLYYYRARYYSPRYQRFISEDPIGLAGGVNLYQYAASSPVIYQDPLGYAPGDKWYGYNNRDFRDWFHRTWKQEGDPDATKEDIEDAYRAWRHEGSPKRDPKGARRKCDQPQEEPQPAPQNEPESPPETDPDSEPPISKMVDWVESHPGAIGAGVVVLGGAVIIVGSGGAATPLIIGAAAF